MHVAFYTARDCPVRIDTPILFCLLGCVKALGYQSITCVQLRLSTTSTFGAQGSLGAYSALVF